MQTKKRNLFKIVTILLLVTMLLGTGLYRWNAHAAATLPATPCTGSGTVTCKLWASAGTIAVPGVGNVNVWGLSSTSGSLPSLPGPVLIVNQGDVVKVRLTNNLAETTSLNFTGQAMIPDTTGVAPGGTITYTFTASKPGTFLYQAGLLVNSQHQVAMGMYGALVVRSGTPNQAYAGTNSAFTDEALLVLSEMDLALNGSASPADFDMRTYHPTYFLINGRSYPQTEPITGTVGSPLLLRFVNAGLQSHSMSLLGLTQNVIAVDGNPYTYDHKLVADTLFPGQTSDAVVNMPNLLASGVRRYAVFDADFILSNNTSQGFGGMLTFLALENGLPSGTDTVGPLTANMTITPSKVDGATQAVLAATVSDALSGNNNVTAAEYYIDSTASAPTALSGSFGTPTVAVSANLPAGLSTGDHTIFVRGQDSAGNWGPFTSKVLSVDQTGPDVISVVLVSNPAQNNTNVTLEVSADDRSKGNSLVNSAEFSLDGGAWTAMNFVTSASTSYFTATISASGAGSHSVNVRAIDEFLNTGATTSVSLMIDNSGPATTLVTASPNSTDGLVGLNTAVPVVRIHATFTDASARIAGAEGFIDTPGADGTGFPFIAVDGLFTDLSEVGYSDIPLSTIWLLSAGNHTIYVHAKDAAGNWGAFASVTVTKLP